MKEINEFLSENKEAMLEVLAKAISYDTVENHEDETYPFGKGNADCLDYMLSLCEEFGLNSKNVDYYAGFGEVGSGEKLLGVIGHLDVVPAGDGWDSDPFTLKVEGDKAYGRGTSDNKGPMISALFAIKYLIENDYPFKKRLRIVFGCNEESGFGCVKHYVEKEGHFDMGFTPDGPYPCCFGEKGIIQLLIKTKNNIFRDVKGGLAPNVVPDKFELTLEKGSIDVSVFKDYLSKTEIKEYSIDETEEDLIISIKGKAAHASLPELGVNAITHGICALVEAGLKNEALVEFKEKINTELNGESAGIGLKDQYGNLTLNVGKIFIEEGEVNIAIDIRCPFTYPNSAAIDVLKEGFKNWSVEITNDSTGLYQPEDSPFVKLLCETYKEITGIDKKPVSMGGGTYARGINNTLAFGADEDGFDTHVHDANEFIRIEDLEKNCKIFIIALQKMLEIDL